MAIIDDLPGNEGSARERSRRGEGESLLGESHNSLAEVNPTLGKARVTGQLGQPILVRLVDRSAGVRNVRRLEVGDERPLIRLQRIDLALHRPRRGRFHLLGSHAAAKEKETSKRDRQRTNLRELHMSWIESRRWLGKVHGNAGASPDALQSPIKPSMKLLQRASVDAHFTRQ